VTSNQQDDDDQFDNEVDTDEDSDTDEGGTDPIEALRAELAAERASRAKMAASLKRANDQAAKLRHAAKGDADKKDDPDPALMEEITTWKDRAASAFARAALSEAGAKPNKMGRLIKLIELDHIEFDDDGPVGLDVQIESIKEDLPELFGQDDEPSVRKTRPTVRLSAGTRKPAGSTEAVDATTLQVRALRAGKV
jgi:hypothetical protein